MQLAGGHGAPGPRSAAPADDQPDVAIALRHGGIDGRGHRVAMRVRVIIADDRGPARPRLAMGAQQHGRVDLEEMARLGGDIGGGPDRADLHGAAIAGRAVAEQQAATFMAAGRKGPGPNVIEQGR